MNQSSFDGFTCFNIGQVTAESFFCEVNASTSNSKSCFAFNNLPFAGKTSKRILEAEVRCRLRKELEFAYQTQGYKTNYNIEVWNINEWYLTK